MPELLSGPKLRVFPATLLDAIQGPRRQLETRAFEAFPRRSRRLGRSGRSLADDAGPTMGTVDCVLFFPATASLDSPPRDFFFSRRPFPRTRVPLFAFWWNLSSLVRGHTEEG